MTKRLRIVRIQCQAEAFSDDGDVLEPVAAPPFLVDAKALAKMAPELLDMITERLTTQMEATPLPAQPPTTGRTRKPRPKPRTGSRPVETL